MGTGGYGARVKFRRKSPVTPAPEPGVDQPVEQEAAEAAPPAGPLDSSQVDDDVERVDLGSLRIPASMDQREVRLQVDEASGTVQAVLVVGPDGALEIRAFAAPRNGELWEEARTAIAAETTNVGGTAEEREGRFGTELHCSRPMQAPDGQPAVQPSRIVGVDGDRWMLRGTFVGRPAMDAAAGEAWDETFASIVVHRGSEAMPVGEALPVQLPPSARRAE